MNKKILDAGDAAVNTAVEAVTEYEELYLIALYIATKFLLLLWSITKDEEEILKFCARAVNDFNQIRRM